VRGTILQDQTMQIGVKRQNPLSPTNAQPRALVSHGQYSFGYAFPSEAQEVGEQLILRSAPEPVG